LPAESSLQFEYLAISPPAKIPDDEA
jgi:hypothetical protein